MRRIPRLRRPCHLPSTTAGVSRATASPFTTPQSSCSCQPPTATPFHPPSLNRLYSSDRQQTPTPPRDQEQEQKQEQDRQQERDLEQARDESLELRSEGRTADAIIDAKNETGTKTDNLNWGDDEFPMIEGPYAPPPRRVEAAREDEVADPTYFPAETAHGLKKIGGLADWWSRPENWDMSGDFTSFRPREKVADPLLIEAAVRRAVVEALALREVGREDDLVTVWPTAMPKTDLHSLLTWGVKSAENGAVALGGDPATVAERLRWRDDEDDLPGNDESAAATEILTPDEVSALAQTWDPSWKSISLTDPRIRFAVTKRVFQLTGHLVPDHQLSSITTVQTLLHTLKKPPKPATLTEELQKRHPDLLELPNVTVAAKRVTRGDKEKALGRFKLMQEEFKKRDLPGSGHGYARKNKELSRLMGGV